MGTHVAYDQHLLDLAFSDLDHLLESDRTPSKSPNGTCVHCDGARLSYSGSDSSHPGSLVCDDCGVVQPGCVFYETMYGRNVSRSSSNYKRIHHWHERISQLLLMETAIPDNEMLRIAERLLDGSHAVISKDTIRGVLRSLNMQLYIEKWLQIIHRCTKIAPPAPGGALLEKMDDMFQTLQEPFNCFRVEQRKNFLNYNYVFCRLFQIVDCTQFCMFFPLIKSKQKLKQLDEMWLRMATSVKWDAKPLVPVAPFAVRIEKPGTLLQRLASECGGSGLAVIGKEPSQMVFRTLDRRSVKRLIASPAPRHLDPPEQESQTIAAAKKRRRRDGARLLRLKSQPQPLRYPYECMCDRYLDRPRCHHSRFRI